MNYCKRFTIKDELGQGAYILFGLVTKEDEHFFHIKTSRKNHIINKSLVLRIENTNTEFREGLDE